jgi:hypothetical protein
VVHLTRPHYTVMTLGHIMQTPLSAMPPPQPDKVETQHLASPDESMHILSVSYSISISRNLASPEVYMHLSSYYYIMRILPWFSRETQDFASLQGCRRQSSIEGMRSIHRIHDKVETQNLASPDEPMHLSSSSYAIHITMFLQYCPAPTASRYAAWSTVRCKCWQSYSGHLQLNDI